MRTYHNIHRCRRIIASLPAVWNGTIRHGNPRLSAHRIWSRSCICLGRCNGTHYRKVQWLRSESSHLSPLYGMELSGMGIRVCQPTESGRAAASALVVVMALIIEKFSGSDLNHRISPRCMEWNYPAWESASVSPPNLVAQLHLPWSL